jgi:hypothetical protein
MVFLFGSVLYHRSQAHPSPKACQSQTMGLVTRAVTFPIVCPRPEAKFVRKSPVSRSMRWCQKHRILCLWRHSVSESTNWTLSMSKSLNAEEADDGLENCLLPSFGAPGRSRRVQSNEDTCLISASEMSVAYFPNRCIDENTEIVRKQHVGSRDSGAGKQETCLSLRHENRYRKLPNGPAFCSRVSAALISRQTYRPSGCNAARIDRSSSRGFAES